MRVFKIDSPARASDSLSVIRSMLQTLLDRGVSAIEIVVQQYSKSRDQERKYHAMIDDIAKTVEVDGRLYDARTWKAWLVREYENELHAMGQQLAHPGQTILSRDHKELVTIRPSSSEFTVREASDFIEFLYAVGSADGAVFSDDSLSYYDEIIQSKGAA